MHGDLFARAVHVALDERDITPVDDAGGRIGSLRDRVFVGDAQFDVIAEDQVRAAVLKHFGQLQHALGESGVELLRKAAEKEVGPGGEERTGALLVDIGEELFLLDRHA